MAKIKIRKQKSVNSVAVKRQKIGRTYDCFVSYIEETMNYLGIYY